MEAKSSTPAYSFGEEVANAVTHGIGLALSIAALVLLVTYAALRGDAWHITAGAIFGATLVLLYTTSTLYHSFQRPELKRWLRKFDHAAIFLLIAGTYTPFVLVSLRGPWGWSLFGVVWALAIVGVVVKLRVTGRYRYLSTGLYLGMGWLIVLAIRPLFAALSAGGVRWLLAGGLCYTGGAAFYLWKRLRYHHAVWHAFVLAGSICHFFAVFRYVLPPGA